MRRTGNRGNLCRSLDDRPDEFGLHFSSQEPSYQPFSLMTAVIKKAAYFMGGNFKKLTPPETSGPMRAVVPLRPLTAKHPRHRQLHASKASRVYCTRNSGSHLHRFYNPPPCNLPPGTLAFITACKGDRLTFSGGHCAHVARLPLWVSYVMLFWNAPTDL